LTYKYVVKNIARKHDMVATMMPKPIALDNGSGMHVNVSLWNDKNEFYDPNDKHAELSQLGRYFGGGIMEHAMSLSAIVAPTTNSYRRLVPGYEAPVYIAWSKRNRSAIVRIPTYFKGEKAAKSKRIEFRAPDPSCNPYLCFAAVLAAGLDGVRKKRDLGDPVDEDIYKMTPQRRKEMGIKQLPGSLKEAIAHLESDHDYLKPLFSDDTIQTMIEMERKESMDVSIRPHPHEFHLYFDI
ncbi:MAG: glutamine synthetase family protein, partial [Nitrososphaerales archaeon]